MEVRDSECGNHLVKQRFSSLAYRIDLRHDGQKSGPKIMSPLRVIRYSKDFKDEGTGDQGYYFLLLKDLE